MAVVVQIAALVVSAVAAYSQSQQARRAQSAQKEAREISSAQQKAEAIAQRRQEFREARVRRARLLQSAENTGVAETSAAEGAVGALEANVGFNRAFTEGQAVAASAISGQLQSAADARLRQQIAGVVGGFAQSVGALAFQNPEAFDNLFA